MVAGLGGTVGEDLGAGAGGTWGFWVWWAKTWRDRGEVGHTSAGSSQPSERDPYKPVRLALGVGVGMEVEAGESRAGTVSGGGGAAGEGGGIWGRTGSCERLRPSEQGRRRAGTHSGVGSMVAVLAVGVVGRARRSRRGGGWIGRGELRSVGLGWVVFRWVSKGACCVVGYGFGWEEGDGWEVCCLDEWFEL